MKTFYVYPKIFTWEQIIPAEYPFIKVTGPDGAHGLILVFETMEAYAQFCEEDDTKPLVVQEVEERGK